MLPVSSLPSPVEIINGKPVAAVFTKQAPNLVTSQAKGCVAANGSAEGCRGFRKGGGQGISANPWVKASAWQSDCICEPACGGQKQVLVFVVGKEPPVGSSEGPTDQGHSAFSVHQLSLTLVTVVRSLKVAIVSQLQLVETS